MSTTGGSGKRRVRKSGQTLIRTAPIRIFGALGADSAKVSEQEMVARVGYLLELVSEMATKALAAHWNAVDAELYAQPGRPPPLPIRPGLRRLVGSKPPMAFMSHRG